MFTVMKLAIDVQGLFNLVERMTLENVGGCNESPIMIELCDQLSNWLGDLANDPHASTFLPHMPMAECASFLIETSTDTVWSLPQFFTVCDLFGYGVFSYGSAGDFQRLYDDVAPLLKSSPDDCIAAVCKHVARAVNTAGCLGVLSSAARYDDLKGTGYDVPPDSTGETIEAAYLSMSGDALYRFHMLVLPYLRIYERMDDYLTDGY